VCSTMLKGFLQLSWLIQHCGSLCQGWSICAGRPLQLCRTHGAWFTTGAPHLSCQCTLRTARSSACRATMLLAAAREQSCMRWSAAAVPFDHKQAQQLQA
jgi:hypothetical protein